MKKIDKKIKGLSIELDKSTKIKRAKRKREKRA